MNSADGNEGEDGMDIIEEGNNEAALCKIVHYPNLIVGVKNEIVNRKSAKIAHIAVYFSTMINNVYMGLLVDSMLQCDKDEMGLLVPALWKDHLLPLLLSLPWNVREYKFGGKESWVYGGGSAITAEKVSAAGSDGNVAMTLF